MKNNIKIMTVEELALDAFNKTEYANALAMMNTPSNYLERKKAFVELAKAQKAASDANYKLEQAINFN